MMLQSEIPARVLIVEDDDNLRSSLSLGFERKGFDVKNASNGFKALEMIESFKPHIVITDVRMPNGSGQDLINGIKEKNQAQQTAILCMSGFSDLNVEECFKDGVDAYFPKPVKCQELIAASEHFMYLKSKNIEIDSLVKTQSQQLVSVNKSVTLGLMTRSLILDLCNPSTALSVYTLKLNDLILTLLKNGVDVPSQALKYLEHLKRASDQIAEMIKSFNFFAQNKDEDSISNTQLNQLIENATRLCQLNFQKKNIAVTIDPINENMTVLCRPWSSSHVLINLLRNASEAIENKDEKWVRISAFENNDEIIIQITDSGLGVSDQIAKKMFEPYFTTKKNNQSTGLGLSISKKIMESQNGKLFYEVNQTNTSFVMVLPKGCRSL